jgi:hypothetical protein
MRWSLSHMKLWVLPSVTTQKWGARSFCSNDFFVRTICWKTMQYEITYESLRLWRYRSSTGGTRSFWSNDFLFERYVGKQCKL